MAASQPISLRKATFSAPPAEPTTRAPLILAIWQTIWPTAPVAAETNTVSPAFVPPATSSRPKVGGHPRHAAGADEVVRLQPHLGQLLQVVRLLGEAFAPPEHGEYLVAGLVPVIGAGHDFAHGAALHHLAQFEGRHVALPVAHAAAHVRVDG